MTGGINCFVCSMREDDSMNITAFPNLRSEVGNANSVGKI